MRSRTALLVVAALLAAGCSSSSPSSSPSPATDATTPAARPTVAASRVPVAAAAGRPGWICRPDSTPNPCTTDLDATIATLAGTTKATFSAPAAPPADCFYVYPTVSRASADNAPLATAPEIERAAHAQAALFASVCRVFVPAYRQVTVGALISGRYANQKIQDVAYGDVRSSWHDYLAHDNGGRPFVLIGHSQGALQLTRLISDEIDRVPAVRKRLLSAILLGGNVTARTGADVGGSFTAISACRRAGQTGCVIAYSSFSTPPPSFTFFGRTTKPGQSVLCTDPTRLAGGNGLTHPYVPADRVTANPFPLPGTGFVAYPGQLRVSCVTGGGATWLKVATAPDSVVPAFEESLGPAWGLHVADVTLALGDLVEAVRRQEAAHPSG